MKMEYTVEILDWRYMIDLLIDLDLVSLSYPTLSGFFFFIVTSNFTD